jgi:fructose/tagatose bisphosphate aldolase
MPDTGALPAGQFSQSVGEFVRWAHSRAAAVEAELGQLPGVEDGQVDYSHASLTGPDEAAAFVEATGVDCLAVSVGNVHLLEGAEATLDLERLAAISRATAVPLVLHGGTGLPPGALAGAIAIGVAKINVGTVLKRVFLEGLRSAVSVDASPHDLLGSHKLTDVSVVGKQRMVTAVRERIRLYGGSERARQG